MATGLALASVSFVIAGILQLQIQKSTTSPSIEGDDYCANGFVFNKKKRQSQEF